MVRNDDSNARLATHGGEQLPPWHVTMQRLRLKKDLFQDESLAPEVDRELLWALVRDELSNEEARFVHRLIICFKSWTDAHNDILVEDFHQR